MGDHIMLDLEEWALVLSKMLRFHFNISEEIKTIVQTIRVEMKPELIPVAEEKSNYGKVVKKAIREMWSLEYEVDDLQHKFADSIGNMDLDNLDVDFIEDMMLKAKPLQSVLNCIRNRQIAKMEEIKGIYADKIKDLRYAKDMHNMHQTYSTDMPKICRIYAKDIPKLCQRYEKYIPNICLRYAKDMPKICKE